jgi:inorganic pyrophosphatase
MRMLDEGEMDDKIIAVAVNDMSIGHIQDVSELPDHSLKELRSFFEDYKKLENKEVIVEDFQGREVAQEVIKQSILDYKKLMNK